jgi:biopolymer transport protein ExbD
MASPRPDYARQLPAAADLDMTPMIDCVFLLMIFFALVIDVSQKTLEDLVLPRAAFRELDDKPPEHRPVLNVLQDGSVIHNQQVVHDPRRDGDDFGRVHDLLRNLRSSGLAQGKLRLLEGPGPGAGSLLDDPILIRADKWTEWRHVTAVMQQCNQADVGFWKVELALAEVDREASPTTGGGR